MGISFRHSAGFGKRMEYNLVGKMLMEGLDVYLPLVDDHGVDCVIKKEDGTFIEVQIKARSNKVTDGDAALFSAITHELTQNFYFELKTDVYHKDSEIGYLLLTDYWSKGIMTQAAREICRIAFEKLDIIRITGVYYEPNVASGRVLEKVGFEYEGTRKNGVAKGDKIYNLCMTGLLKENFGK